ncbi:MULTISPECIES: S8 family serine peptidase [unclassified Nonomuraea]|uniref:S8 family serine peptidase n=1 Tax=unclassified Nonomuraea TaxID=2593643 RepID=UPI0033C46DA8
MEEQGRRRTRLAPAPRRGRGAPDPAQTRIVQFWRSLVAGDMARLQAEHGLALTAYVPNLAYVERIDGTTVRRLRADLLVRAVTHYLPAYKLAPGLEQQARRPDGTFELTALLFDGADTNVVATLLNDVGARDVALSDPRAIGGLPRAEFVLDTLQPVLRRITDLDDVRFVSAAPQIVSDDVPASSVIQSGTEGGHQIWDRGLHGEGQIIGILDSSPVDINHEFFRGAAPNTPGPAHRKVVQIRQLAAGEAPARHGTVVAGCAVGDHRTQPGGHNNRGMAWAARMTSSTHAMRRANGLIAELNAAMVAGAFIHSNSWHDGSHGAGNPAPYTAIDVDADTFAYTNEDHLLLGSSGNANEEQGPPGTSKNTACVSAATDGDEPAVLGDGNNGPTLDGRTKPDVVAVGTNVTSALFGTAEGTHTGTSTSRATPHAAGAAALIRQYFTEGWYPTGEKIAGNAVQPTGSLLKAALVASTVDMPGIAGFPNDTEGWGLIRLQNLLFFRGARRRLSVFDVRHAVGPTQGDLRTHHVTVEDDAEELRVVLVWADPPGTPGVPLPQVNDLDLIVTAPSGATFRGNQFLNGVSDPNHQNLSDSLNNVEVVRVRNPEVGRWTVAVRAFTVQVAANGGRQGYAVVVCAALKSKCFVAGTVYQDPDHIDVCALRDWRDRNLARLTGAGLAMRALVRAYAVLGPVAAVVVERFPAVRGPLRTHVLHRLARRVDLYRAARHEPGQEVPRWR